MWRPRWSDMSPGIYKTLFQIGMIFNTKAYTQVDTLFYPYTQNNTGTGNRTQWVLRIITMETLVLSGFWNNLDQQLFASDFFKELYQVIHYLGWVATCGELDHTRFNTQVDSWHQCSVVIWIYKEVLVRVPHPPLKIRVFLILWYIGFGLFQKGRHNLTCDPQYWHPRW